MNLLELTAIHQATDYSNRSLRVLLEMFTRPLLCLASRGACHEVMYQKYP